MKDERGKVSVLMGIYNCVGTLKEAVQSIQDQEYPNWELLLCDDGSDDGTYALAQELQAQDERIFLLHNDQNRGLNYTLNRCLSYATGEYIARQDGDDRSVPERFSKQVSFLQHSAEYDIVSSAMIYFDEHGEWGFYRVVPYPEAKDIIRGSPICHAPVMMRRQSMMAVGGYTVDPRMLRVEDVNLWLKLYEAGYKCYNIQQPLYCVREDKAASRRRKYRYRINSTYVRLKGCKALKLGVKYYVISFKPMVIGLIPSSLIRGIKRARQKRTPAE